MSTITLVDVGFRCVCGTRVDVAAAMRPIADGEIGVSSNGGRTEHEGKATIQAASPDEAVHLIRTTLEEAAAAANTTCETTILRTRVVTPAI